MSGLCKTVWISPLLLLLHPASVHHQFLVPTSLSSCLLLLPITSYIQASADSYQVYHYLPKQKISSCNSADTAMTEQFVAIDLFSFP